MGKFLTLLFGAAVVFVGSTFAQNATTTPVGAMTVILDPSSNGATYKVTPFSTPLLVASTVTGNSSGKISAVTSNSVTDTTGAWVAAGLTAEPHYLRITSGSALGRIFFISANTDTSITVAPLGVDLSTLGIQVGASGDSYQIVKGFTLLGLIGTPSSPVGGVVGGTSSQFGLGQTDKVLINDSTGVARFYYFDTTANQWRRIGSATNQGSLPISPMAGLVYYRISTSALAMDFTGAVPDTQITRQIPTTGTTLLSSYFPTATTLAGLGLDSLSGWRKLGDVGVDLNSADRVLIKDPTGVIRSYYHDGTNWKRVGSASNQNSVPVPEGAAIQVTRFGTPGQYTTWTQSLPYTL
jgi:uncharacterized protein (TIGR02597 family)